MVKNYVVLLPLLLLLLLLLLVVTDASLPLTEVREDEKTDFLNEWVVEVEGDLDHVRRVVERRGFEMVREMSNIENHYILKHKDVPHRSKRSAGHHTTRLVEDRDVKWAEQQFARKRVKRDVQDYLDDLKKLKLFRPPEEEKCPSLKNPMFTDPEYNCEWYLAGDGNPCHKYMTNCQAAWKQGYTGKGVVVCVVDDGLETNHSDIQPNYDPYASWDMIDDDPDPMARYDPTNENKHGTRCAGEIAMVANNSVCGVGIAYNCKIGGIRLLDGNVTDRTEAESLSFNCSHVDIFSLSWGPTDDGKTMDMPRGLAQKALDKAIATGRGGKGNLFFLASGNGGGSNDNCNCDGYASSMYTISVSAVGRDGTKPWFGECCASTLTSTYSNGGTSGMASSTGVVSADLHGKCTRHHSGTSAAAPLAAGVTALALEANPNLTWIDVQHLIIVTSKSDQLEPGGWKRNAAGFCFHPCFGFGLMDCEGMVNRAKNWTKVPPRRSCTVFPVRSTKREERLPRKVMNGTKVELTFDVDQDCCQNESTRILFLEHLQFFFSLNYTSRGAISAYAVSPNGTETCLLDARSRDNSSDNYEDWPVMTVATWGENPCGTWKFWVEDENVQGANEGLLLSVRMVLHGTATAPAYRSDDSVYCTVNTTNNATAFETFKHCDIATATSNNATATSNNATATPNNVSTTATSNNATASATSNNATAPATSNTPTARKTYSDSGAGETGDNAWFWQ